MQIRRFRRTDLPRIKEIHKKAGYGFSFSDIQQYEMAFVVEAEGKVVGFAGAISTAEIVGLVDPDFRGPHERMRVFAELHLPLARQLELRGIETATIFLDPTFPKFGKRLSSLGWKESKWRSFFIKVSDVIKALK